MSRSTVEICDDPQAILPEWRELIEKAPASPYQTPGFLMPWLATRVQDLGIAPLFIVERNSQGEMLALYPFGLKKLGPFRAAVFLGAKDSNFNIPLFHPGYRPDRATLAHILREGARAMDRRKPDLFLLLNQPLTWQGAPNPLASLPRQWAPSFAYGTSLTNDAASFLKRLSKETRKKLRKKEERLAAMGETRHLAASGNSDFRTRIIDAFFTQKIARFESQNIDAGFERPAMRRFVELAIQRDDLGALELHALMCGEKIVAVYGGATCHGHFSAFFNSFDADPEIAKSSPGDLLLLKLMAAKSAEGITGFDLGIGEARYKNLVCDETIPLFDSFIPVTWRGSLLAAALSTARSLKRQVKQNKKVFEVMRRLRGALRKPPFAGPG